jgi:hypothetical protein
VVTGKIHTVGAKPAAPSEEPAVAVPVAAEVEDAGSASEEE